MKIFITGGCGYVGTQLVISLLANKYELVVIDNQWFGNFLPIDKNLKIIKKDIRNVDIKDLNGCNSIIHLANIANDPSVELNPVLSWEVNCLASNSLINLAIEAGVDHFIYASSGSVYGVKEEDQVTEDLPLVPISVYNKTKMIAERTLLSYREKIQVHCIRPATVCGYSQRMRLDLSVNMLTMQALKKNEVTVFGGDQTRPNIHIKDMVRVYEHFLKNKKIESGFYNAGFENLKIIEIANIVKDKIGASINITDSNDPRSYRQNSDKLISTGFKQSYNVNDAIDEIIYNFRSGRLEDKKSYYNINVMKNLMIN